MLGCPDLDIDTNFFDAGGSSLLAPRLVRALREMGSNLTIKDLFRYPTVRQQARLLASREGSSLGLPGKSAPTDSRAAAIRRALRVGSF